MWENFLGPLAAKFFVLGGLTINIHPPILAYGKFDFERIRKLFLVKSLFFYNFKGSE